MMKRILCLFIFLPAAVFGQSPYYSEPAGIKSFADHLFCSGDYLRASAEYGRYLSLKNNDTVKLKMALSFYLMDNFAEAAKFTGGESGFMDDLSLIRVVSLFKSGQYISINEEPQNFNSAVYEIKSQKIERFSSLIAGSAGSREDFLMPFSAEERDKAAVFYERYYDPPIKSPLTAGILSALVPGAGKIYAGRTTDGIISFVVNGLLGFIAYDNFRAGHDFRGGIFAALTAIFYAGNIYGSAAAAQIFNAGVSFNFGNDINIYLNENNFYLPAYEFCN